jgi:hypothetical protein
MVSSEATNAGPPASAEGLVCRVTMRVRERERTVPATPRPIGDAARVARSAVAVAVLAVSIVVAACTGNASVPVHGVVTKTVGRPCELLSAAFPGVGRRVVTFSDDVGLEVARAVTGDERQESLGSTGCRLSAPFVVDLPIRHAYVADVSSAITDLPPSAALDYDTLALRGWRFDVRIPATG